MLIMAQRLPLPAEDVFQLLPRLMTSCLTAYITLMMQALLGMA
jgi:hypothetical protein